MKIAVFGASGNTGIQLVKQALDKGHEVTAFVRDPARLPVEHVRLTHVIGDVFNAEDVARATQSQDAVVCTLGAGQSLKKTTVRTTGTANIIAGMKKHGVKRLLVVTAMGTGDSWDTLSAFQKLFYNTLLRSARRDHGTQEVEVKKSGLDWTIVRPSGLTDDARTGVYDVGENIPAKTSRIARADVADFILKEVEQNKFIGKAVTVTN